MKRLLFALRGCAVRAGFAVACLYFRLVYRPRVVLPAGMKKKDLFRTPVVLIANHRTHLDGILLPLALGRRHITTFVAKDWYEKPLLHPLFCHLPYLPLNREELDTEWLARGVGALAKGRSVLIFPEGKTEKTDGLSPFHPGFALLARHGEVPVVPAALPEHYRPGRRNTIRVGEPLPMPDWSAGRVSRLFREAAHTAERHVAALAAGGDPLPLLPEDAVPEAAFAVSAAGEPRG